MMIMKNEKKEKSQLLRRMKKIKHMKKTGLMAAVLVLGGVGLLLPLTGCGKKASTDLDLSSFETPDGFEWTGEYMDDTYGQAVLNITEDGKKYSCMISVPNKDLSHIDTYQFTAEVSEDGMGLAYTGGSMTSMDLPDFAKNPDAEMITTDVYSDGSGAIYYLDGYLYWLDDVNEAGNGLSFRRLSEDGSSEAGQDDVDSDSDSEASEADSEENSEENSEVEENE